MPDTVGAFAPRVAERSTEQAQAAARVQAGVAVMAVMAGIAGIASMHRMPRSVCAGPHAARVVSPSRAWGRWDYAAHKDHKDQNAPYGPCSKDAREPFLSRC